MQRKLLALLIAVPLTIVALFFLKAWIALFLGACCTLFLSLILFPTLLWIEDAKYRRSVPKAFPMKFSFRDRLLLRLRNGSYRPACLYFHEKGMIIVSLPRRGEGEWILSTIPQKCVWQIQLQEHIGQIRICFYDNFFYEFICHREEELLTLLRKHGWNVSEPPRP